MVCFSLVCAIVPRQHNMEKSVEEAMNKFMEWIKPFETKKVVAFIHQLDPLHNVTFMVIVALFIAISLFMKWRLLLSCTISLAALITLTTIISGQGTDVQNSDSLFMFIGGGAVIMFFLIYMIFMRGD